MAITNIVREIENSQMSCPWKQERLTLEEERTRNGVGLWRKGDPDLSKEDLGAVA